MLRLLGFGVLVFVVWRLFSFLPFGGSFIGLWLAVLATSALLGWWGNRAVAVRRNRNQIRALGAVDTPANRGKLGAMLLGQGRAGRAVEHLEAAAAGEPDVAEWHYRLGQAHVRLGATSAALESLRRCVELDEEHAYGQAQLAFADALRRDGAAEEALTALDRFDRNHGESPESLFRRGQVLRALGRKDEARAAFDRVGEAASRATQYQKGEARGWALRATLARLL